MSYLPMQPGVNLGAPSLQIGRRGQFPQLPPQLQQQMPQPTQAQAPQSTARQYGIAEALSNPATVESGSWGEAVAEALASGLRGRAARADRQSEESLLAQELARQQASDQRAQETHNLETKGLQRALEQGPETWSEPFDFNGTQVQRNNRDNQYRTVVPPAATLYQPPSGYAGTREQLAPIPGGPADPNRPGQQRQLRGADARQLTRIQTTAESARGLRGLVDEFAANLEGQDTFPGSGVQVWDPEVRTMTALAARMTGLMRPAGSGATSDFEQRLYARGAPSVDNTREANQQIIEGIRKLADISDARQQFYEEFASQNGSLLGAEQAFQQSPDFQQLTGAASAPAAGSNAADGAPPEGVTPEEWAAMTPEERALFRP